MASLRCGLDQKLHAGVVGGRAAHVPSGQGRDGEGPSAAPGKREAGDRGPSARRPAVFCARAACLLLVVELLGTGHACRVLRVLEN